MNLLTHVIDSAKGKHPLRVRRSPEWPRVRKEHLLLNPNCAVCGSDKKVQVHHKIPFHVDPTKELDPSNLITLCESRRALKCHLIFGHCGNFHLMNPQVGTDAPYWNEKIKQAKQ